MSFENNRATGIKSSPSMAIAMAAKKLAAEGRDIIDLSLGEPDFEPPEHVAEAAMQAIRKGGIRYGAPAGMVDLRQAISRKFKVENGLDYTVDEVMVANGAKQILLMSFSQPLNQATRSLFQRLVGFPTATSYPCTVASLFMLAVVPRQGSKFLPSNWKRR